MFKNFKDLLFTNLAIFPVRFLTYIAYFECTHVGDQYELFFSFALLELIIAFLSAAIKKLYLNYADLLTWKAREEQIPAIVKKKVLIKGFEEENFFLFHLVFPDNGFVFDLDLLNSKVFFTVNNFHFPFDFGANCVDELGLIKIESNIYYNKVFVPKTVLSNEKDIWEIFELSINIAPKGKEPIKIHRELPLIEIRNKIESGEEIYSFEV